MKLLKTKFDTPKTKVNNLEIRIPHITTLIHINQYNTNKKIREKKNGDVDKKMRDSIGLVTTTVLNTKNSEVENKIPDTSSLMITTVLNIKICEIENKITDNSKYITT